MINIQIDFTPFEYRLANVNILSFIVKIFLISTLLDFIKLTQWFLDSIAALLIWALAMRASVIRTLF
jgi:hypothetical protein